MDEFRALEIEKYCELQLIKKENKDVENVILNYMIRKSAAKLESFGVNPQDLTLMK